MGVSSKSAVLVRHEAAPEVQESEIAPPEPGGVLAEVLAAGVCSTDVYAWQGLEEEAALPLILGHEGAGHVLETGGDVLDARGRRLEPGDTIVWDIGSGCGACRTCSQRKGTHLCAKRSVFGLNAPGCFADHFLLPPCTTTVVVEQEADPALLAMAACPASLAIRAVAEAGVGPESAVVVYGPGPMGALAAAAAKRRGARTVAVIGPKRSEWKLEACRRLGADVTGTLDRQLRERLQEVFELSDGRGADVVIDCAVTPKSVVEAMAVIAADGMYVLPAMARPGMDMPLRLYEDVIRKNLHVQGIAGAAPEHLLDAVDMLLQDPASFGSLVTHHFALAQTHEALLALSRGETMKATILPQLGSPPKTKRLRTKWGRAQDVEP